jgi:hypothetical protein
MEHRGAGMALGVRELCTEMEGLPLLVKALMVPLTLALWETLALPLGVQPEERVEVRVLRVLALAMVALPELLALALRERAVEALPVVVTLPLMELQLVVEPEGDHLELRVMGEAEEVPERLLETLEVAQADTLMLSVPTGDTL